MDYMSPVLEQIYTIPQLMRDMDGKISDDICQLLSSASLGHYKKVILTGCGDSLCAAMAARYAFRLWTHMEAEVEYAVDLARTWPEEWITEDTLVIVISHSGSGVRLIEIAKRMRRCQIQVVAVTSAIQSELAQNASLVLEAPMNHHFEGPGICSYTVSLYTVLRLAFEIGLKTGCLDTASADRIRKDFTRLPDQIEEYLLQWTSQLNVLTRRAMEMESYECISSGWNLASSWFACAKSLEISGKPSSPVNTEDWFHMNYFIRQAEQTETILIARAGDREWSRACELAETAKGMKRPLIWLTDAGPALTEKQEAADLVKNIHIINVPALDTPLLHVLIDYIPLSVLMDYYGWALKETYFRGGVDNWSACQNLGTIINSEEVII